MVGLCTILSKSKEKQLIVCSGEFDDEPSSGLKEILSESEGVYQQTRIWTGIIALMNYSALSRDIDVNEACSTIAES